MKRHLLLVPIALALFVSIATGCGAGQSTSSPPDLSAPTPSQAQNGSYTEADISVKCKDLNMNSGMYHDFALDVSHKTSKYLTAEIYAVVFDADDNTLGDVTVFINNLSSSDWESKRFFVKLAPEYYFDYQIVSYKFTDSFTPTPEITDETVKDYIRVTTTDYEEIRNGEREVACDIHNLSSRYFYGTIEFTVKDSQGNTISTTSEVFDNIKPFNYDSKLIWFPYVDDYAIDYSITEYDFSDSPIVK